MFCRFKKRITPKIHMLYFVLINNVLFNLLCVWILINGLMDETPDFKLWSMRDQPENIDWVMDWFRTHPPENIDWVTDWFRRQPPENIDWVMECSMRQPSENIDWLTDWAAWKHRTINGLINERPPHPTPRALYVYLAVYLSLKHVRTMRPPSRSGSWPKGNDSEL